MAKSALVNLSTGDVRIEETHPDDLRRFLGGRGLGAKLLYELVGPEVDPLGPDNTLIFTAAPLAGSPVAHRSPDARHLQVAPDGGLRLRQHGRPDRGRAEPRGL